VQQKKSAIKHVQSLSRKKAILEYQCKESAVLQIHGRRGPEPCCLQSRMAPLGKDKTVCRIGGLSARINLKNAMAVQHDRRSLQDTKTCPSKGISQSEPLRDRRQKEVHLQGRKNSPKRPRDPWRPGTHKILTDLSSYIRHPKYKLNEEKPSQVRS
jgi:hypothetical protein